MASLCLAGCVLPPSAQKQEVPRQPLRGWGRLETKGAVTVPWHCPCKLLEGFRNFLRLEFSHPPQTPGAGLREFSHTWPECTWLLAREEVGKPCEGCLAVCMEG